MKTSIAIVWLCVVVLVVAVIVRGNNAVARFVPKLVKPAIVGGTPADPARYPYFASLVVKGYPGYPETPFCGGILTSKDKVLTAMHCLGEYTQLIKQYVEVEIGMSERRKIKDITIHPALDIAMITLATPSTKRPIAMASALPPSGSTVTVLGRGQKTPGLPQGPANYAFEKVNLKYMDGPTVARLLEKEPKLDAESKQFWKEFALGSGGLIVLVGPPGKSPCSGDSGGPVILEKGPGQDQLLGLASLSIGTSDGLICGAGMLQSYTVFTSIPAVAASGWPFTGRGRACVGCERLLTNQDLWRRQ